MPRIDHAARRRRIVAEALRLFAKLGYAKVNFGMVAEKCGLSRTMLYNYFRDKRAIFNEAIDLVTSRIAATCDAAKASDAPAPERLRRVCADVFATLSENRDYVCVIADFLSGLRRRGTVPVDRVKEHTEGLVRTFRCIVAEGVGRGELRADADPDRAAALLYSQFEAFALRIAVTGGADLASAAPCMDALVAYLSRERGLA